MIYTEMLPGRRISLYGTESPVTAERDSIGTDGDTGLQKTRRTQGLCVKEVWKLLSLPSRIRVS